jgi:hypothetical protein
MCEKRKNYKQELINKWNARNDQKNTTKRRETQNKYVKWEQIYIYIGTYKHNTKCMKQKVTCK